GPLPAHGRVRRATLALVALLWAAGCAAPPPAPSPTPRAPAMEEPPGLISLVYLLSAPRRLSEGELTEAVQRAYRRAPDLLLHLDPTSTVELGGFRLQVHCFDRPYVDNPAGVAESIADPSVREPFAGHQAWLSVDVAGHPPGSSATEDYRRAAPLLAELAGPDVLLLLHPETNAMLPYDASLQRSLRAPDPLAALKIP
ncbi:MAG: hypothetical protein AB1758_33715, partial [Candidatus Eremiobacterota bacterium]